MSTTSAHKTPDLRGLSDEVLKQWVAVCVDGRKNGATPSEIASLCKVLRRLAPALAAAVEAPGQDADFELTLEAMARG